VLDGPRSASRSSAVSSARTISPTAAAPAGSARAGRSAAVSAGSAVATNVLHAYEGHTLHAFRLKEALSFARAGGKRRISEITPANLLDEFLRMNPMEGSSN
jgi:hypothetical protein